MDSSRENIIEYDKNGMVISNHTIEELMVANQVTPSIINSLPRKLYCKKCGKEVPRNDVIKYKGKWYCKSCFIQLRSD